MSAPVLLIVEETIQRAYRLDASNPDHAELINGVMSNPLEGEAQPIRPFPPPALLGRRANKGSAMPWIALPGEGGRRERLDPDAEHSVNSMMTLLHLDEGGKPFHQIKFKRTTIERGPVKS